MFFRCRKSQQVINIQSHSSWYHLSHTILPQMGILPNETLLIMLTFPCSSPCSSSPSSRKHSCISGYPPRTEPPLSSAIPSGVISKGHAPPEAMVSLGLNKCTCDLSQALCHQGGANLAGLGHSQFLGDQNTEAPAGCPTKSCRGGQRSGQLRMRAEGRRGEALSL